MVSIPPRILERIACIVVPAVERPDVVRRRLDLILQEHDVECLRLNVRIRVVLDDHTVVSAAFGFVDNRLFISGIGELPGRQLCPVRILHIKIERPDSAVLPGALLRHGFRIVDAFRKPIRPALRLKHREIRARPVVHRLRRSVLVYDLARMFRMVLPIPKPTLELPCFCLIFKFRLDRRAGICYT